MYDFQNVKLFELFGIGLFLRRNEAANVAKEKGKDNPEDEKPVEVKQDRMLKGVMRVGLLAKGLLLKTDREVGFLYLYNLFILINRFSL